MPTRSCCRHVVDVDGRRRRTATGKDAADRQQILRVGQLVIDTGSVGGDIGQVLDVQLIEGGVLQDREADRHPLDVLRTLLRGNHDFSQHSG